MNYLKKFGSFSKQESQYSNTSIQNLNLNVLNTDTNFIDLDVHIQEINKFEKECKSILKNTKKLIDNIANLNRFQIKLSEDLSNSELCQQYFPNLRYLVEEWYTFNRKVNNLSEDFNLALLKVLVDPLKQYQQILNELKSFVKKSETLSSDLTKQKTRILKLKDKEKQAKDWLKLDQSNEAVKKLQKDFDYQTETLLTELPLFLNSRIEYFQPMLEGFIKSEAYYWGESLKTFALENQQNVSQFNANKLNLKDYETSQNNLLLKISTLSIVDGNENLFS